MEQLDLKRLFAITKLIEKTDKDCVLDFGTSDELEYFLYNYSFKIDEEKREICYYYDEPMPYEDYNITEYNYIPYSWYFATSDNTVIEDIKFRIEHKLNKEKQTKEERIEQLKTQITTLQNELQLWQQ